MDKWVSDKGEIINSVLAIEDIRSNFENTIVRVPPRSDAVLEISDCELPQVLKVRLKGDVDLIMKDNSPHQNLKIAAKTVFLSNCRAARLDLDTFISHQGNSEVFQFKYSLDFAEKQQTQIYISGPKTLTRSLQWNEVNRKSRLVIRAYQNNKIQLTDLYIGEIALNRLLHDPANWSGTKPKKC